MKKTLAALFLLSWLALPAVSQNSTLFGESRMNSVFIEISIDSLSYILSHTTSDHYCKARFIFDDGSRKDTLNDVGFRLRGNTSRSSQKKSFKISFNEYSPGRRYQGVKKINLNGQHNDPSLVREKLYYDIWKRSGMPERRTTFVKMFINSTYMGVYTLLEEYDKDWLKRVYGENDGNLYKCTYPADLVYINAEQQTYKNIKSGALTGGRAYELQTNETTDDYSDLVNLVTQLNQPVDAQFESRISALLNVDSFLKTFAIDVATGNWDDYAYLKNNYYLYHNLLTGKFEFIAYDCDNTFGVDWFGIDWATRNCLRWQHDTEKRPLATKLLAVPAFNLRYRQYLDTLARLVINPGIIFGHIDSLKNMVADAALTDKYRSYDYGYTWADFNNSYVQKIDSHTPYGIKPFLSERQKSILLLIRPLSIGDREIAAKFSLYPNPATSVLTLSNNKTKSPALVSIYDAGGTLLNEYVWNSSSNTFNLPVNDLKPGMYLVRMKNAEGTSVQKFVKL